MPSSRKMLLLFIHGFLGSGKDWEAVPESLKTDCLCEFPDLPGHGNAPSGQATGEISLDTTLANLLAIRNAHPDSPCVVIAYSMGGRIALHFSHRYPKACDGLVLVSASPGIEDPVQRALRRQLDDDNARKLNMLQDDHEAFRNFLEDWYQQEVFASLAEKPALKQRLIDRRSHNNPAALAKALRAFSSGTLPSLWKHLPHINQPTLLLAGKDDPKYCTISQKMTALLPHASTSLIEQSGHCPHLENPHPLFQELASFLQLWFLNKS
jgi:2-succinyl-6-hydroxy-2,4-cyclohexadiene-1-carboxylate synthase